MAEKKQVPFLMYKGRPLVRKGTAMYYGNMTDSHVIMMQILSTEKKFDLEMAAKVSVSLIATDPDIPPAERIVKKSEKSGMYDALDIASIWLERALEKEI